MEREKLERYFERLGLVLPEKVTADGALLEKIFRGHVTHVPYENIDYLNMEKTEITFERLYRRMVEQKRGGVCYDLNALLSMALNSIGYEAYPVMADHYRTHMEHTQYRHSALLVKDCEGNDWLCDPGDSFSGALKPLRLEEGTVQHPGGEAYRLEKQEDGSWMLYAEYKGEWLKNYAFFEKPASLEELTYFKNIAMDPEIPFTHEELFHLRTAEGFMILRGRSLSIKNGKEKTGRTLEEKELEEAYALFGLKYPCSVYRETTPRA